MDVKCLACGCVFDRALEMCPQRYLTDHSEAAMQKAAEQWAEKQKVDFTKPPSVPLYFHISGEKWDGDHQRNALLHFLHSKGLDDECLEWLYANAPKGWFREDD